MASLTKNNSENYRVYDQYKNHPDNILNVIDSLGEGIKKANEANKLADNIFEKAKKLKNDYKAGK